ncbi:MAG: sn-glycerol-3-phosphate ABC transporter ATP-binding protein UgpC [Gemmatimonadota bacterium]
MANVRLESVRKTFLSGGKTRVAVDDVSLDVADGEFCVLVGPSGCGKSTTLRIVAGLEGATSGQVSIGGRDVTTLPAKERDIAMVFQSYALYPHMTAYENMAFALKLRHMPREEIDDRVRKAGALLGIGEHLDRKPRQLSGGERQRIALGRAIVRQPKVFLFDEPLSNLDAKLRLQMRREIAALHRRLGATMIYVTHDQVEAMTLGDRIVVLDKGRVQQIAPPMELYDRPRNVFVASFIGSPAMNLVPGEVGREGKIRVKIADSGFVLEPPQEWENTLSAYRGRSVMVGVRPEDLRLTTGGQGMTATVELAELLGNELLLHTKAGGTELTARLSAAAPPNVGAQVDLAPDPLKLHFFDRESGVRLVQAGM